VTITISDSTKRAVFMYDVNVIIKLDTRLGGLLYAHTWVEVRVWERESAQGADRTLVFKKAIGLTNGEAAQGTQAMKQELIASFEKLDRPYSYKATIPFASDANLFSEARMMEMGQISVKIMKAKGGYWLFNNNCRAFVDIFLGLCLGLNGLTRVCFDIIAADKAPLLYCHNYLVPYPFWFRYDGWTTRRYKVGDGQIVQVEDLPYVKAVDNSSIYDAATVQSMIDAAKRSQE
jgi:hypothetical protein